MKFVWFLIALLSLLVAAIDAVWKWFKKKAGV